MKGHKATRFPKRLRIMTDTQRKVFNIIRAMNGKCVAIDPKHRRTADSLVKRRNVRRTKSGKYAISAYFIERDTWWVTADYLGGLNHDLDTLLRRTLTNSTGSGYDFTTGRRDVGWSFRSSTKAEAAVTKLRIACKGKRVRVVLDTPEMQKRRERQRAK